MIIHHLLQHIYYYIYFKYNVDKLSDENIMGYVMLRMVLIYLIERLNQNIKRKTNKTRAKETDLR